MNHPLISVIIPVYNQADFLAHAVQSVLDQTYPLFEIIVVDDASPDHTPEVVRSFRDDRIRYIRHEENRHLAASRNTGIHAARGEIIALLDADDYFHPQKLAAHAAFLAQHPEVGVTYNSHYELNYNSTTIRELFHAPKRVDLSDLVLGFPFAPSDMVVRKEWLFRVGLFDEGYRHFSEDLDINCRLALAGCQFARVDGVLNYRRHHSRRRLDTKNRLQAALETLDRIFADPRCPAHVAALRNVAYANNYMVWSYHAFDQNETELAQHCVRQAITLNPSLLESPGDAPCPLLAFFVSYSAVDCNRDHAEILRRIMAQLPSETAHFLERYEWAVARGHLLKGTSDVLWGRTEEGKRQFARAKDLHAQVDEIYLRKLADDLLNYSAEFGGRAAEHVLAQFLPLLESVGGTRASRFLEANFYINRAFRSYRNGQYGPVPRCVRRAVVRQPAYLANRGVLSVFVRSSVANLFRRQPHSLHAGYRREV